MRIYMSIGEKTTYERSVQLHENVQHDPELVGLGRRKESAEGEL